VSNAAVALFRGQRRAESSECHTKALAMRRELGEARGISSSLGNLALLVPHAADALPLYVESVSLRKSLGDTWGVAGSLRAMAATHQKLGQWRPAAAMLAEAVPLFAAVSDRLGVAECLESLAVSESHDAGACNVTAATTADSSTSTTQLGGLTNKRNPTRDGRAALLFAAAIAVRRSFGADEGVVMEHAAARALQQSCQLEWARGLQCSMDDAEHLARSVAEECSDDAMSDLP